MRRRLREKCELKHCRWDQAAVFALYFSVGLTIWTETVKFWTDKFLYGALVTGGKPVQVGWDKFEQ